MRTHRTMELGAGTGVVNLALTYWTLGEDWRHSCLWLFPWRRGWPWGEQM